MQAHCIQEDALSGDSGDYLQGYATLGLRQHPRAAPRCLRTLPQLQAVRPHAVPHRHGSHFQRLHAILGPRPQSCTASRHVAQQSLPKDMLGPRDKSKKSAKQCHSSESDVPLPRQLFRSVMRCERSGWRRRATLARSLFESERFRHYDPGNGSFL